jgi:NitT/TauT family transport system substrate-binding protein
MNISRRSLLPVAAAAFYAPPQRLRVAAPPHTTMAPLHLAIERGYFRNAGLDIEIVPLQRSSDALPVLAKGRLDAAIYSINPPLINAIAKGARIRIVASRNIALPDCGDIGAIYVSSRIGSVSDLKEKRISNAHAASVTEFSLDTALSLAGVPRSTITRVSLQPMEAAAALLRGEVDAIVGSDLTTLAALRNPKVKRLTDLGRLLPGHQYSHIEFGASLLDGPADTGIRFLRAFYRGVREFIAGATPKFLDDFASQAGRDFDSAALRCRKHFVPDGRIDLPSIGRFVTWAFSKGYCEKSIDAASLIDGRFLETAAGG